MPKRFKGYCTDVFFEEAMDFATAHKDEPFFTYIACNAPHSPFNVANRYSDRYTEATSYLGEAGNDRANFYGMVTCIDDNVQRMRDHLRACTAVMADGVVKDLSPCIEEPWQQPNTLPEYLLDAARQRQIQISTDQWQDLCELDRFALCKLARPGHDHHNLDAALSEVLG